MKIYSFEHPDCTEICNILQTIGKDVTLLTYPFSFDIFNNETFYPSVIVLPLYFSRDSQLIVDILAASDLYEIPILFVYKRTKKLKDLSHIPKKGIYETIAIPSDHLEVKLKLQALQNISFKLYSAKVKELALDNIQGKIQMDLNVAKNVQKLILPPPIQEDDIEMRGIFQPSSELSGDLFFWMDISKHEYGFIIIDVCGKGLHAALISMAIRSLMPGLIKRVKNPFIIAEELNDHMGRLFKKLNKETFYHPYFTAFIAHINTKTRVIEYVNGGHPPAYLYCPVKKEIFHLIDGSLPIGLIPNMPIKKGVTHYEKGSRFLAYTDGLAESPNHPEIVRFDTIEKEFLEHVEKDTELMLHEMLRSRMKHSEISDDICIIAGTLF